MALDLSPLLPAMMDAAAHSLGAAWPEARDFAETEFKKSAATIELIARLHARGAISEERARLLLEVQKSSAKTVLLTLEGLGILAAEGAINAALSVVRDTVNAALGFTLV